MNSAAQHKARELRSSHGQALAATFAVGLLYLASPTFLGTTAFWLIFLAVLVVAVVLAVVHVVGRTPRRSPILNWVVAILTVILAIEVASLVVEILQGHEEPLTMLRSAGLLWITNWLVFTIWYWRIDAGGPHARHERPHHSHGDFLFSQMTISSSTEGTSTWSPGFVDYLFLAFTANTALSPTDVPVLSRRAKGLMMLQSLISISVIVFITARAVNLLHQSA
jgi:hypothetical protein